jgi:hypothetical protein
MKRLALAVAIIGLLVAAFPPLATARSGNAPADNRRFYQGTTSQDMDLLFDVLRTKDQGDFFEPFFTNFTITCPKTGDQFTFGFFFLGFQEPIVNRHFDLNFPDLQIPFDWNGTVRKYDAFGHQSLGFAAYDGQGGLQDCGTGELNWKAERLGAGAQRGASQVKGNYHITIEKNASGKVTETISFSR